MVTGKGGVGKSAVAAALAQCLSKQGKRVLLVEVTEQSYYAEALKLPLTPQKEVLWQKGLFVSQWTGEGCLREYIRHLVKVDRLADLFFDNKIMQTFIRAAPALKEIAILGKLTSALRHVGPPMHYDAVVFDAYSTGHYLALLQSPKGLGELVEKGPMGEQARSILELLQNSQLIQQIIVTLAEELPAQEALELNAALKNLLHVQPTIICNRVISSALSAADLIQLAKDESSSDTSFARYLADKIKSQEFALKRLEADSQPVPHLPFVFQTPFTEVVNGLQNSLQEAKWF